MGRWLFMSTVLILTNVCSVGPGKDISNDSDKSVFLDSLLFRPLYNNATQGSVEL